MEAMTQQNDQFYWSGWIPLEAVDSAFKHAITHLSAHPEDVAEYLTVMRLKLFKHAKKGKTLLVTKESYEAVKEVIEESKSEGQEENLSEQEAEFKKRRQRAKERIAKAALEG